jgi:phosphatidylserine/phosphatidylglycerophosphate/cardiolipin synthase-like enzyme
MGGSTNWTNPSNLFNDYNNIIFIQDEAVAKAYTMEFDEMWVGTFGTNKSDNTPHKFIVGGSDVEVYFSPSDQTTSQINKLIESVNYTFEFGLLSFTRDDLAQTVIDKNAEFGVSIRGIIEDENSLGGEFANLQTNGVNMRSHTGVSNSFHHKYAIADANAPGSDPIILTGSHNWSSNAENNSDENTLIIHDATIANIYLQEFEKRWGELGAPNNIDELIDINLSVFPNPTSGKITVSSDLEITQINLYAADGKLIFFNEGTTIDIDIKGIYFIKIITEKGNLVKKIIVE